jgi:DNA-binding transcriptional LysR family regulator
MNLTRIQYFVEVAKRENFSQAAQALYVSQPNLSKQISLMEQELGFDLFRRVGKTVHLTQAGRYLYEKFKDLPEYTAQAIAHAHALSRGDVGNLSVGILEGQDINTAVSHALSQLRQDFPEVEVELERNSFRNLRNGLDSCRFDAIITLSFELDGRREWASQRLLAQEGAIAINRRNPLAEKEDLRLEDLERESFVAIAKEESPGGYDQLLIQCAAAGFYPNIVREASTLESLLLCVETGMGAAIVDRNTRLENDGAVRVVPLPGSRRSDVVAVWQADNPNPMIGQLVNMLSRYMKETNSVSPDAE